MPDSIHESLPVSPSGTVSWVHIGDLHMTKAGEQNEIDLGHIVDKINRLSSNGGIDFAFLPGDIADDGSAAAYKAVRQHLDRLQLPWCGIVGDHDVHEKSFETFQHYIANDLYSRFVVGKYRFLRLNAFSVPKPDSFEVNDEQLQWMERELQQCEAAGEKAIVLLHCYPSDLKKGGKQLSELLSRYPVLLVDMGHTHYNELSNDGKVLYSATRSTGQIEEGPVGCSITTVDGTSVSWYFMPLGTPSLVAITQPADERLLTERTAGVNNSSALPVHAKVWSTQNVRQVSARLGDIQVELQLEDGALWRGMLDCQSVREGTHELQVTATLENGEQISSASSVLLGDWPAREFASIDQQNSIDAWPERGLLGTQLGPNKNGKKW